MSESKNIGAKQAWKNSGTSLSFAQWIEREKGQGRFLENVHAAQDFRDVVNADGNNLPDNALLSQKNIKIAIGAIVAIGIIYLGIKIIKKSNG